MSQLPPEGFLDYFKNSAVGGVGHNIGEIMKLKGKMIFRNNQVYVWDGNHAINLFSWLASFGLKDKEIEIEFVRGNENEVRIKRP